MVPDKFNPSRFLCGIPQILLPLTFARNLMQLAPSAKGLRLFCSGPCSLPVARICLFGLYRPILCVLFGFRHNSIMACCSMIQVDTIHLWLPLFHAPARLSYCPSRQFIHMATSLSTCLLASFIVLLPFALLLFTWLFFRLF